MRGVIMDLAFVCAIAFVGCGLVYPDQTTDAVLDAVNGAQRMLRAVLP